MSARRPRVLIAEDCPEIGHGIARLMRGRDYVVDVAYDGVEALDLIRREEPDVLLLDLGLPRLHGFKLLHRLRMSRIDVPVVVLTGDTVPQSWEKAVRFGVERLFLKPTPAHEVVQAIDELLRDD